jgi:hypothetical protein
VIGYLIMKGGDLVKARKVHPYDGSSEAGKGVGPMLTVTAIVSHKPVDGPEKRNAICMLEDGSWEFIWNLELHP